MGLEAEDHAGKIVEFAGDQSAETTDEERRKNFLESLRSVMRGKVIDPLELRELIQKDLMDAAAVY